MWIGYCGEGALKKIGEGYEVFNSFNGMWNR